jgi:S-phase kinase-associated protein 1
MDSLALENNDILSLDNDNNIEKYIILKSKDNVVYKLTAKEALLSNLFKNILSCNNTENDDENDDENNNEVKIDYNSDVVEAIVSFLIHHNGVAPLEISKPLSSSNMNDVTTEWCASFLVKYAKKKKFLYDLVNASNYLDIQSLLHLCCAKIASLIKGTQLDKIKDVLNEDEL